VKPRFVDHVGLAMESPGAWTLALAPHHNNAAGFVHGGVLFTLADTAMGSLVREGLGEGESFATVECKISYLKPVQAGQVVCQARMLQRGRSLAHLEADVLAAGVLAARASATFAILPRK
jgi:acyl-CoA thioesterase